MRPKSALPSFEERIVVPAPRCLVDAVQRASAPRLQDKAEYVRQALVKQLRADGVSFEPEQAA
jgi:hypothetical protein